MMKNNSQQGKSYKIVLFSLLAILVNTTAFAQSLEDALGFTETVNDVPEAPISLLVGLAALIGSFIGFRKLKS